MKQIDTADAVAQVRVWIESGKARELRTRAGLTLADAGQGSGGVHPSAVLHWERGRMPRGRNVAGYHRFLARLAAREETAA